MIILFKKAWSGISGGYCRVLITPATFGPMAFIRSEVPRAVLLHHLAYTRRHRHRRNPCRTDQRAGFSPVATYISLPKSTPTAVPPRKATRPRPIIIRVLTLRKLSAYSEARA